MTGGRDRNHDTGLTIGIIDGLRLTIVQMHLKVILINANLLVFDSNKRLTANDFFKNFDLKCNDKNLQNLQEV